MFDDLLDVCNWPWAVPGCGGTAPPVITSTQPPVTAAPTAAPVEEGTTAAAVEEVATAGGVEEVVTAGGVEEVSTAGVENSAETEQQYTARYKKILFYLLV